MVDLTILVISIIFQIVAAILALRLIKTTGTLTAWVVIAAAITLMMLRRIIIFAHIMEAPELHESIFSAEVVGLIVSVLLVSGLVMITDYFRRVRGTESALQVSESRFTALFESSTEGIIVTDHTGHILMANKQIENLFDYKPDELTGQCIDVLIPERLRIKHKQHFNNFMAAPLSRPMGINHELLAQRKDRGEFPVEIGLSTACINDEIYIMALVTDITQRIETRRALHEAKDAAEAADRAKTAFIANMSHELRTPLNTIIGFSEFLQENGNSTEQEVIEGGLGSIGKAGHQLLTLVNEILGIAEIQAGTITVESDVFSIKPLVEAIKVSVRPLLEKHHNTLTINYTADLPDMLADVSKVRQILTNLLSNAAKFTYKGSVTLTVDKELVNGESWVIFKVTDTGIGITKEQMKTIFLEFVQADSSITRKYSGTGLGLPISRYYCQMMGGEITVESEPDKGSTFTVRLPFMPRDLRKVTSDE